LKRISRIPGRTLLTRDDFRALTRPLLGMSVTHSWRGSGSAIFLELGALTTVTRTSPKGREYTSTYGEATFMLEWSWRVESKAAIQFGSWSKNPRITRGVASLRGHTILDVDVEGRIPELVLTLDGKRWVHTFMTYEGQPAWAIRQHDHSWLAVDRGRLIRQGPAPKRQAGVG
jgi:hypothetical protein